MEHKALRQLTFSQLNCPRCGGDHYLPIIFIAFDQPVVENDGTTWTFWGSCPRTLAPILAREVAYAPDHTHFIREQEE